MSEAPEVQSPADVPVHVHLVLAQGSTKTRAEYLEAEFAAIRAASTVSQLNQRIREAQNALKSFSAFSEVNAMIARVPDDERETAILQRDAQAILDAAGRADSGVAAPASDNPQTVWSNVYFHLPDRQGHLGVQKFGFTSQSNGVVQAELDSKIPNFTGRFDDFGVQASVSSVKSTMFGFQWHMPRFMAHRWGASFGVHRKNDNRVETSSYNLLSRGFSASFHPWLNHSITYNLDWRDVVPTPENPPTREPKLQGPSRSVCLAGVPSVKSSISHSFSDSTLDNEAVPKEGHSISVSNELAGLGGDIEHFKSHVQLRKLFPITSALSLHASTRFGGLYNWRGQSSSGSHLPDRFLVGGADSVRGFEQGGIGPRDRGDALGADAFCEVKTALEFDLPNAVLQEAGLRGQLFVNGGTAVSASEFKAATFLAPSNWSAAGGVGIALPAMGLMRFELNYTMPLQVRGTDRARPAGLQFGVSVGSL